jgi:hypothetical protein
MRSFSGSRRFLLLIFVLAIGLDACAENERETALNPKENTVMIEGTSSTPVKDWWRPAAGLTWQWQLTGPIDLDLQPM